MTTKDIPSVRELSDEELNTVIAECCGWTRCVGGCQPKGETIPRYWRSPKGREMRVAPNYSQSLDAIATAVAVLNGEDFHAFCVILSGFFWPLGWQDWRDTGAIVKATARQRSEAFAICRGVAKP